MGNVLLVAEHNEGKLRPATSNGVTFAAALKEHTGGELLALVIGLNVGDIATQMAGFSIDGV
ncbi:MAG: electron transfer flavoprotein subunit alpha/FixB family protein, partial [Deltaproteobacteria bacterium]|nr:electron transfer flavoprotein subunit alpha/FixB family protein [Deltaproteobacteria bacterium]